MGVHLVRAALVLAGLWASLMVAAAGLWMWTDEPGVGLLAAGVASAAVLFLGVDTTSPERPGDPRAGKRTPGL